MILKSIIIVVVQYTCHGVASGMCCQLTVSLPGNQCRHHLQSKKKKKKIVLFLCACFFFEFVCVMLFICYHIPMPMDNIPVHDAFQCFNVMKKNARPRLPHHVHMPFASNPLFLIVTVFAPCLALVGREGC